jgi:hypothetical protein
MMQSSTALKRFHSPGSGPTVEARHWMHMHSELIASSCNTTVIDCYVLGLLQGYLQGLCSAPAAAEPFEEFCRLLQLPPAGAINGC